MGAGAVDSVGKGKRSRLASHDRKAQIIEVAGRLIAERGFWGVSVHDIASGCGITDAGVLHHFRSKERLLLAVLEHRDEADRVALSERLGLRRENLYDAIGSIDLERLCDAMVRRNAEQPEIVRLYSVLSAEALEPPHPAHDYFLERERVAIETFAAARSTRRGDPLQRGRIVLAAMDGVQLRWLRCLDRLDLVEEWRVVFGLLFGGGRADAEG